VCESERVGGWRRRKGGREEKEEETKIAITELYGRNQYINNPIKDG